MDPRKFSVFLSILSVTIFFSACRSDETEATSTSTTTEAAATGLAEASDAEEATGEAEGSVGENDALTNPIPELGNGMSYIYAEDPGEGATTKIVKIDGEPIDVVGETRVPIAPGKRKIKIQSGSGMHNHWKTIREEIEPNSVYKIFAKRYFTKVIFLIIKVEGPDMPSGEEVDPVEASAEAGAVEGA